MLIGRVLLRWVPAVVVLLVVLPGGRIWSWQGLALWIVAFLGLQQWFLAGLVSAAAYFFLDVPLLFLGVALAYRLVYVVPLNAILRRIRTGPDTSSRRYTCTPVFLCRHRELRNCRRGDRAMRAGRSADALLLYLEALVAHPAGTFCSRALSLRAAEAANELEAPELARALAGVAVRGLADTPIFRSAVIAARGYASWSVAASALGQAEEASAMMRRAQSIVHRNVPADRLVRLSAVAVRLAAREASDQDQAQEALVDELVPQELTKLTAYELGWLSLTWARILHARGRLAVAETMYRNAVRLAGDHPQSPTLTSLAAADSVSERDRRVGSLLVEAVCGQLECLLSRGKRAEDALYEEGLAALRVASALGCTLIVTRLCAAIELSYGTTKFRPILERQVELGFALYADSQVRHRWEGARGGSPWPAWVGRPEIEEAGRRALELAKGLAKFSLAMSRQMESRIHETLGTDQPVGGAAIRPDEPAAAALAGSTESRAGEAELGSGSENQVAPDSYRPRLGGPPWLTRTESLTGGPCVTLRLGWEICAELGHRTIGVEHLLAAALADAESAAAFVAAGLDLDLLGDTTKLIAGGNNPEGVTAAAEAVLTRARVLAQQSGAILVRPWQVVVATLTFSPSSVHAVLAAAGVMTDEVITRLVNGANNLGLDRHPDLLPEPAARNLSLPVRQLLSRATDRAVRDGGGKIGIAELVEAVVVSPTTSPELRDRAARLTDVAHAAPTRPDPHSGWSPSLRAVVADANAVASPWMRGIDVADLLRAAEGRRSGRNETDTPARPSEPLRALVKHAITLASNSGHSYVGPEHLAAALRAGLADSSPGWVPATYIFTPLTKEWLAASMAVAQESVVTVEHLSAAQRVSSGSGLC